MTINVLFVCLGNICRSPTAHGVFEEIVNQHNLQHRIIVDSAGTAGWHIGKAPDSRSCSTALDYGYDLSALRSRKVSLSDFSKFDYILAMDQSNFEDLKDIEPDAYQGTLSLLLDYADNSNLQEVPDPYYGDGDGFKEVLLMIEQASKGLFDHIIKTHNL